MEERLYDITTAIYLCYKELEKGYRLNDAVFLKEKIEQLYKLVSIENYIYEEAVESGSIFNYKNKGDNTVLDLRISKKLRKHKKNYFINNSKDSVIFDDALEELQEEGFLYFIEEEIRNNKKDKNLKEKLISEKFKQYFLARDDFSYIKDFFQPRQGIQSYPDILIANGYNLKTRKEEFGRFIVKKEKSKLLSYTNNQLLLDDNILFDSILKQCSIRTGCLYLNDNYLKECIRTVDIVRDFTPSNMDDKKVAIDTLRSTYVKALTDKSKIIGNKLELKR